MSQKTLQKTNWAKVIKQGLIVMAITAIGLTLFNLSPAFAQSNGGLISTNDNIQRISDATGGQGSFRSLAKNFLNFFLGFLGFIAVIMVIYGGILYVTAAGAQEKVDEGKKIIMYAIIGIVIILLSFAIVNTVLSGLGSGSDTTA